MKIYSYLLHGRYYITTINPEDYNDPILVYAVSDYNTKIINKLGLIFQEWNNLIIKYKGKINHILLVIIMM